MLPAPVHHADQLQPRWRSHWSSQVSPPSPSPRRHRPRPPSTPPTSSRSPSPRASAEVGEPMSMAVLPDRSVLHTARDGTLRRTDVERQHQGDRHASPSTPTTRRACRASRVDPNFATNRYVYLYYAPPLSTPAGDAPATGTAADWSTVEGRQPAVPVHPQRRLHAQHGQREDRPARCQRTGACAATSAATSTSTPPATCTCPPATTPTRSTRPATRRSTSGPTATPRTTPSARAGNTNDLRGKILRIKVQRRRHVHDPGRQPVRAGHGAGPGRRSTRWASATRSG